MSPTDFATWGSIALLGAYHGINPSMGWLFAVALGLQNRSRASVVRALGPIAIGHGISVAGVLALVSLAHFWIDPNLLHILGAVILIGFGIYKLAAPLSHPRWVGMRVNARDLVVWSFLMSSAHGAGLMLMPVVFHLPSSFSLDHATHLAQADPTFASSPDLLVGLVALIVHTAAMLVVMAAIAIIVYEKVGIAILRKAWLNLDRIWAGALIIAGWVILLT
jgi:hypothetical protein